MGCRTDPVHGGFRPTQWLAKLTSFLLCALRAQGVEHALERGRELGRRGVSPGPLIRLDQRRVGGAREFGAPVSGECPKCALRVRRRLP